MCSRCVTDFNMLIVNLLMLIFVLCYTCFFKNGKIEGQQKKI